MSALLDIRAEIVAALVAQTAPDGRLPKVQVSTHGGMFTAEDAERYSKRSPALVLSLLAAPVVLEAEGPQVEAHWVLFCIANDAAGKRDAIAIWLADAAVRSINWLAFETATASRVQNVTPKNVFSPTIDKMGLAMWSIMFTQRIELRDDTEVSDELRHVHSTWVQPGDSAPTAEDDVGDPL